MKSGFSFSTSSTGTRGRRGKYQFKESNNRGRKTERSYYWSMVRKIKGSARLVEFCQTTGAGDQRGYRVQKVSSRLLNWHKKYLYRRNKSVSKEWGVFFFLSGGQAGSKIEKKKDAGKNLKRDSVLSLSRTGKVCFLQSWAEDSGLQIQPLDSLVYNLLD